MALPGNNEKSAPNKKLYEVEDREEKKPTNLEEEAYATMRRKNEGKNQEKGGQKDVKDIVNQEVEHQVFPYSTSTS